MMREREKMAGRNAGTAILTAVLILLLIGTAFLYSAGIQKAYEDGIRQIAGQLYEKDRTAAEEMLRCFFEEGQERDIAAGEKALDAMSYTDDGTRYLYRKSGFYAAARWAAGLQILCAAGAAALFMRIRSERAKRREAECALDILNSRMEARETQFKEKEKMTQNFIENVMHQIKTPLSCIVISMERLNEKLRVREEREITGRSLFYAGEIEALMKRLLDIGRMEAGRIIWHKESFCLGDMLSDCAEDLTGYQGTDAGRGGVEADGTDAGGIDGTGESPGSRIQITGDIQAEYHGDYEWLKEAFSNMIKNALEHDPRGKAEVMVRQNREGIKIVVADRGAGFAKEDLPHIFDRFYLPDRMKKSHVGIGLNLARLVIEQHFGTVKAQNREGGGAEFTVFLPLYAMKEGRI